MGIVAKVGLLAIVMLAVTVIATIVLTGWQIEEKPVEEKLPVIEEPEEEEISELIIEEPEEIPPAEEEKIEELITEIEELIKPCADKVDGTQKDYCLRELALSKSNEKICHELTVFSKDECLKDVAIKQKNGQTCKDINNTLIRDDCYKEIALKNKDGQLCRKISRKGSKAVSKRNDCFKTVAEKTDNAYYCQFIAWQIINGLHVRDSCYWNVMTETKDSTLCEKFYDKERGKSCTAYLGSLIEKVPKELSLETCNSLTDLNQINCYKNLAAKDNNYLICDYILDDKYNRTCMLQLIEKINADIPIQFCQKIRWIDKGECYKKMAYEKEKAEFCVLAHDIIKKYECYYDLAVKLNNGELCENAGTKKDKCYKKIAIETKDAGLCEKIKGSNKYYDCYYGLAVNLKSYGICMQMKKITHISSYTKYPLEQMCYRNYAIEIGNENVCDLIIDYNLQKSCIDGNAGYGIVVWNP